MDLTCPRCQRTLEYSGERPSFCAYCGQALSGSGPPIDWPAGSTMVESDATIDYRPPAQTEALGPAGGSRLAIPETIAGYRLIRRLGQGGMGSVHEAEEESSGRRVAVKLIAAEHTASAPAVERFLQEGRLASGIAHPRCVFVLAADQSDGWPYIVMELMPGHTLKDLVEKEGPLPQGEAVRKILDVIEGLDEAHKLGVIHRDVKPSNCFLDDDGRVKVGDFGLSKSLLGSDADLTRTGSFLGTPHYAAPEQIKGETTDAKSDVYSVAATLFYLLTGRPPFEGVDATVTLARIVTETPPSVRSIRPEVWSALDDVVLRGLERDRRRRIGDLDEFRVALEPFLPGRVTVGGVGLRLAAYAFDFVLFSMLIGLVIGGVEITTEFGVVRTWVHLDNARMTEIVSAIVIFAYFFLGEVLGSASPGKRVFGLRLASVVRGGPMGWRDAILRLLIFFVTVGVPRRVYTLLIAGDDPGRTATIASIIHLTCYAIVFSSARRSNGFRGLHELLSGTGSIRVPGIIRRRRRRPSRAESFESEPAVLPTRPDGLPDMIGPFITVGALVWEHDRRVLLAEDQGLGRSVWIVMAPSGSAPIAEGRHALGRIARPRWLNSGEIYGWSWDAFVAPSGRPLPDVVASRGRVDWPEARAVVDDLAVELAAADADGTLPDSLAPEDVWVQPDGRVSLIDAAMNPLPRPSRPIEEGSPSRRSLELLRRVAIIVVGGRSTEDAIRRKSVGAPIPLHAIGPIDRLVGGVRPYETVAEFLSEFDASRQAPPELSQFQRLGLAAYTFVSILLKTWLIPMFVMFYILITTPPELRRGLEVPDAAVDQIIVIQSCLWVALAFLIPGGLGNLLFRTAIVRSDGRRASGFRVAWRETLIWLPLILVDFAIESIPQVGGYNLISEFGWVGIALAAPLVVVGHSLIFPGRFLHDRPAGTAVVPR